MNAHYTPFSILRTGFSFGVKLTVTTDKKLLPKDLRNKGMLGATVKFLKLIGSQVSVKYMGNNHFIPLEAVLNYKDYTVALKPIVSDTLFIVVAKHQLFEVGTVFETSLLRDGQRLGFYDDKNRLCVLDESILALSKVAQPTKASDALEALSNKFSVKPEQIKKQPEPELPVVIEPVAPVVFEQKTEVIGIEGVGLVEVAVQEVTKVVVKPKAKLPKKSLIKDGSTVTSRSVLTDFVDVDTYTFDCINKTINDIAKDIQGEFTDLQGLKHTSLMSCLKSNQSYTDLMYLELVKSKLNDELEARS